MVKSRVALRGLSGCIPRLTAFISLGAQTARASRAVSGRRTRAASSLAAAVAVTFVGFGCDSIDPTSQSFGITFHNDTSRDVHLKLCSDDRCHHFDYSEGWHAGQSAQENISDRDLLTRWLVQGDADGRTLGCLPLRFDQKYDDVVVRISQAVPCPGKTPLEVHTGRGRGRS